MSYSKDQQAIVETQAIGDGTSIRAFAHILAGARIGADCTICDHTFIEGEVTVGDRTTIQCGVQLWGGIEIEHDVFIGPNATFTRERLPNRQPPGLPQRTVVKHGASIGANATILPDIVIGENAIVSPGAVVTASVPANAIVAGNPARIIGYCGAESAPEAPGAEKPPRVGSIATKVAGVTWHRMPLVEDLRGPLTFGEISEHVPFEVKRYFVVFDVSSEKIRGEHAHRTLQQFLVCVHGRCHIVADDGENRQEFELDSPSLGLYLPPMVWAAQYKYSSDGVLLALVSDRYDPADYIRDYTEFLRLRRGR